MNSPTLNPHPSPNPAFGPIVESKQGIANWSKAAAWGVLAAAATSGGLIANSGCTAIGFAAESYQRNSTHEIKAQYEGLKDKTFAVVVTADRMIEADHPGLVDRLASKITEKLSDNKNLPRPAGFVPTKSVLRYLYDNPSWPAKPLGDLAKGLGGVDRLVYIEITEYRLNDPGNAYEWDGVASGTVAILETDSSTPDEYAFDKVVSVKYPDQKGVGPSQMTLSGVSSVLSVRFIDRVSWLFYDHQEAYYPEY